MGQGVDVVLIIPGGRAEAYQSLAKPLTAAEPPVWAGLIAAYVQIKGFQVEIIDANALWLSPKQAVDQAVDTKPKLAVVVVYGHNPSASTQNMPAAGEILKELNIAAPDIPTLTLGGHPAALPEQTMKEQTVDYVCNGEGPISIVDMLTALKDHSKIDPSRIRGIVYRNEDGQIVASPPAPLIEDLDNEMPGIAWDLLPMDQYRAHNWQCFGGLDREPYASFYTTLGCPFKCSFCCIQAPFRSGEKTLEYKTNSYRRWSPKLVVDQIGLLVERYGIRNIKIADEMFVLNRRHVEGICDGIIERGYDLNIWAYARVKSIKQPLLDKLKKAGVNWLCLGIESGSERVLEDVRKGYKLENVHKPIAEMRAAGINIIANYLVGLPEDDLESMQKTLDLALELNCEFFNLYCAMAYPGSKLYGIAVEKDWPLPESWTGYSQLAYETKPLPTKYLSAAEVLRFRDEAFNTYFTSQSYLQMIREKFGEETVTSIQKMTGHSLERKYV
ncbi:MAG: radical SAM protein [Proteobacteria bacterium]|nr:radical SAM protein [Pseudomonadota bacterium]